MNCPKCGENSAVQSTRTIVGAGTSNMSGSAVTFPILGDGPITTTYFGSTTTSNLAYRLTPPAFPIARLWPWVLVFTGIFTLIAPRAAYNSVFTSSGYFTDSVSFIFSGIFLIFGFMIGLILGLLFGAIMRAIGNATWMKPAQQAWYPRSQRIWNTYYCGRDDTMFDYGFAGAPEQFISHVWFTPLESEIAIATDQQAIVEDGSELEFVSPESTQIQRTHRKTSDLALSASIGNCTFEQARHALEKTGGFPSVSSAVQKAQLTHKFADISSTAGLSMFREGAVAELPIYCAIFPIGKGGYTRVKSSSALVALSQQEWRVLDDVLANDVVFGNNQNGDVLISSAASLVDGYSNALKGILGLILEVESLSKLDSKTFAEVWTLQTGINAEVLVEIIHSHRDVLLFADYYRVAQWFDDTPTKTWQDLTDILILLERFLLESP